MGRPFLPKTKLFDLWYRPEYFAAHCKHNAKTGCTEWHGPSHRQGYGMVGAWRDSDGVAIMTTTHRIAARQKLQRALDPSEWIVHTCRNPRCVNPDHLELGDRARIAEIRRAHGVKRASVPRGPYRKK